MILLERFLSEVVGTVTDRGFKKGFWRQNTLIRGTHIGGGCFCFVVEENMHRSENSVLLVCLQSWKMEEIWVASELMCSHEKLCNLAFNNTRHAAYKCGREAEIPNRGIICLWYRESQRDKQRFCSCSYAGQQAFPLPSLCCFLWFLVLFYVRPSGFMDYERPLMEVIGKESL